jgi:hypothetical protein
MLTTVRLVSYPEDFFSQMKCGDGPPTWRALVDEGNVNLGAQHRKFGVTIKAA